MIDGYEDCIDLSNVLHPSLGSMCNTTEFRCIKNGAHVCLNPHLRCDQHPQCDGGEDEEGCEEEYRQRGYMSSLATYECLSPHHNKESPPGVKIWATRCDLVLECYGGVDEDCDILLPVLCLLGGFHSHNSVNTSTPSAGAGPLLLYLISWMFLNFIGKKKSSTKYQGPSKIRRKAKNVFKMLKQNSRSEMLRFIKKHYLRKNKEKTITIAILQLSYSDVTLWEKREIHKIFYSCLITAVGSKIEAHMWMKKHMSPDLCNTLLADVNFSGTTLQKLVDKICFVKTKITEANVVIFLPTTFVSVLIAYQDLLKDLATVTFLLSILSLLPFTVPNELYSQIFWLLLTSLVLPLVSSALHTAAHHPYTIFGL